MDITLANNLYAFSVPQGLSVTVKVLTGTVDYSSKHDGPFQSEQKLSTGQTAEYFAPGLLFSSAATLELDYPHPPDPAPADDQPEVEPQPESG